MTETEALETDIAIVGLSIRVPGARNARDFWELVKSGRNAFVERTAEELTAAGVSPELLANPDYVRVTGPLEDVEAFDAGFFDIGPRDAAIMDPQHRHFLECCWEALEDAALPPSGFDGSVGVYAGSGMNGYMINNLLANPQLAESLGMFLLRHTSNDKDFLATGVSYKLNLTGPSVNIQNACSTSLVAVHVAAQALANHECDMALAGGVTIEVPHNQGYLYREGEILAKDGVCRAFDAKSSGTILTSGAGVVVLRRLTDALAAGDRVYAVIKASAINNDGAGKVGYLAPSVDGHAAVVTEAIELAGVQAESIQYLEAHGTGTPVGDPIEVAALTQAFGRFTRATGFCRLGSTKPSVGHLDTAAGVASLIKTSLALYHGILPPMANFTAPNALIELERTPFTLSGSAAPWPRGSAPRRAGISSLGVGGTNAHVILQEAPGRAVSKESAAPGTPQVLTLSAKSPAALERARLQLADYLESPDAAPLRDVAWTLQAGREAFAYRTTVAAECHADAARALRDPAKATQAAPAPSVAFMFPGGGAQYPNMGLGLYTSEPVYRTAVDACLSLMPGGLGDRVRPLLFPACGAEAAAEEEMARPSLQLPAIFTTEYALAQLWGSWGIKPAAMTGHSLGEYAAACHAGVFSLRDALRIVALRGEIMERMPDAAMLSVALPQADVEDLIAGTSASLAAVNSPELCVVSGETASISALEARLDAAGAVHRRLKIIGAVHCALLDPFLDEFRQELAGVTFSPPAMPYVSNVTGTWVKAEDACSPDYWVRHLRHTVRFADGMATLLADSNRVCIEVGPGTTLTSLARQQAAAPVAAIPSLPHPNDPVDSRLFIRAALGRAWAAGVDVDWRLLHGDPRPLRVSLPTYAFERERHWIEPAEARPSGALERQPVENWAWRPVWSRADFAGAPGPAEGTWLVVGDGHLPAAVAARLKTAGADPIEVRPLDRFVRTDDQHYGLPLASAEAWRLLIEQIANEHRAIHGIIWAVPVEPSNRDQDGCFYGILTMLQAVFALDRPGPFSFTVVSRETWSVDGEAAPNTLAALAEGLVRVAPREFERLSARMVDLPHCGMLARRQVAAEAAAITAEALAGGDAIVALRGGKRWVRTTAPLRALSIAAPALKRGGHYLITGGLGGLGLSLAAYLAASYQAKLSLVSRRTLPPRDAWAGLMAGATVTEIQQDIAAVQAIEAAGGAVELIAADIASRGGAAHAVALASTRFGTPDGVFHAAGGINDAPILTKTRDDCEAVLAPKVSGAAELLLALDAAPASFLCLFSSTSAELGIEGQVDYAAANAYLNALAANSAASGARGPRVFAVSWGRWDEIGMASGGPLLPDGLPFLGRQIAHGRSTTFVSRKSATESWVLDDHRLADGTPVMPGTGYLQALTAAAKLHLGAEAVTLTNVQFKSPLTARERDAIEFRVQLRANDAVVTSGPMEHAAATVQPAPGESERAGRAPLQPPPGLPPTIAIAPGEQNTAQERHLRFGPRWKVLREVAIGDGGGVATLELQPEFGADLAEYALHPGMLDLALSFALPLVDPTGESLYVPVGIARLTAWKGLQPRVKSVARLTSDDKANPVFDVEIRAENGDLLVSAEGMRFRAITGGASFRIDTATTRRQAMLVPAGMGLRAAEAWPLLDRAIGAGGFVTGISSVDIRDLVRRLEAAKKGPAAGVAVARPTLQTGFVAPGDAIEESLAAVWSDALGIEQIGVQDDFFELGGHSLVALRVLAKVRDRYGLQLPLATMFDRPTVARLAELIRAESGEPAALGETAGAPAEASGWSPLVTMRAGGPGTPFYCVHGMFGNVMVFKDLARAFSSDRPFVAVQQHGVDGVTEPLTTIEAMASAYLAEIRKMQPAGPYYLGGYSVGGAIAFEMAHQLRRAGEEVGALVMLDTRGRLMVSREPRQRIKRALLRLRADPARFLWGHVRMRGAIYGHVIWRRLQGKGRKTVYQAGDEVFQLGLGEMVMAAERSYPYRPIDVPITLVTATLRDRGASFLPLDLGWSEFAPRVDVRSIDATHDNMCVGTNAVKVAEALADVLALAGPAEEPRARAS
jgi:acyl transferase domain-containing protein/thioesterase domain-containing protein/acyl carrier protein